MPSEIEILIHGQLMGGCTHPDFDTAERRESGRPRRYVVCTKCGVEADYPFRFGLGEETPPTNAELMACLKATIPPYCADLAMSRDVLRHLEAHGWHWTNRGYDGLLEYTLTRGERKVTGEPAHLEHDAIVNALSRLAREARAV